MSEWHDGKRRENGWCVYVCVYACLSVSVLYMCVYTCVYTCAYIYLCVCVCKARCAIVRFPMFPNHVAIRQFAAWKEKQMPCICDSRFGAGTMYDGPSRATRKKEKKRKRGVVACDSVVGMGSSSSVCKYNTGVIM